VGKDSRGFGSRPRLERKNKVGSEDKAISFKLCCFPTLRKEREGWGTQCHPLWVG